MWCPLGVTPAPECREGRSLFGSPQNPDVTQLAPARGNGSGAEGLAVVPRKQGRKDTICLNRSDWAPTRRCSRAPGGFVEATSVLNWVKAHSPAYVPITIVK